MSFAPLPGNSGGLSTDLRSLDQLKSAAGKDPKTAIKDTSKQLEGLFMQELMKSMRATTMNSGMLDNNGTEMGNNMLDTQLANQMSGIHGGLGDMIARQLERQMGVKPGTAQGGSPKGMTMSLGSATGAATSMDMGPGDLNIPDLPDKPDQVSIGTDAAGRAIMPSVMGNVIAHTQPVDDKRLSASERFVRKHQQAALAAEAATGIPANNILGQAALESGWGKHEIRMKDGTPSHNLFGIKATSDWKGKVAEVTTTEYYGGVPRRVTARFRAYDSYEAAFKDHANLLTQSPRYRQIVAQADTAAGFARGLQKAGYATDPAYAEKLARVINTTLRLQRTAT